MRRTADTFVLVKGFVHLQRSKGKFVMVAFRGVIVSLRLKTHDTEVILIETAYLLLSQGRTFSKSNLIPVSSKLGS